MIPSKFELDYIPSKFEQDFDETYGSILDVINCLREETPIEMVALVLLSNVRFLLEEFTHVDQLELIQEAIDNICLEIDQSIESQLPSSIDTDLQTEKYNKRYAQPS